MDEKPSLESVAAQAALTILESLLVELQEAGVLSPDQIRSCLEDAIAAHENAARGTTTPRDHAAIAELIRQVLVGASSSARFQTD